MIESYSFGRMVIKGRTFNRDLKIIKGVVHPDWWRNEGHYLRITDLEDIISHRPKVLVVGCGASGAMHISPGLSQELKSMGITLEHGPTKSAAKRFNELIEELGEDEVAGAFHLTC